MRFRNLQGAVSHFTLGGMQGLLGLGQRLAQGFVLEMEQDRFGLADLTGDVAVAAGLTRLTLQGLQLVVELADDIDHAFQILLGGLQAQLGLVTARMQTGNACRLFQQHAAVGRLGVDDGADAALADHGGRIGARGEIGEQQLHVAHAHFVAVDAVVGALLALDAARDLQDFLIVEGRRRGARLVVEGERDFSDVAGRTRRRAGEDHVVHARATHALGGILAHHPAQRFHQVGLAATIRTDDPGQAGMDDEIRRLDEGLEAGQAQLGELHGNSLS
jgi:hypothetical protein